MYLLDTNVVSELRKLGDGKADARVEAWVSEREATSFYISALTLMELEIGIHPFRDGNGRVSRLLTLLALLQHGYEIGRYISLERLVEESCESYYDCLHQSSQKWHEAEHDPTPWFSFFFAVVRRAYSELEKSLGDQNLITN